MKLGRAFMTVGGLTGLSRVFGLVRDVLTAAILGAGPVADAFFIALKLPNFFRRVTAEGAFSVAFVPLYSKKLTHKSDDADYMASNVFAVMGSALTILTVLAIVFMPCVIDVLAPGFEAGEDRFILATTLSRITFPYLLFMSLTALLGGVLNARDRFAPFAAAPILFNIALIVTLLFHTMFQTPGHAMAWGLLVAGVAQLGFLVVCVRRLGVRLRVMLPRFDTNVRTIFKLMGPGVIGAGVMHINLFADIVIASFLPSGSIAHLYYADRLNQLPLGIVGIAVGTALLPMLSKALADKDNKAAGDLFNRAMEMVCLFALPAAIALMIIPEYIIGLLFERGAFDAGDTAVTAMVLRAYAIGLPAYIAVKVFSTAHWARHDTITPVKISVIATLTNIAISLIFVRYIGAAGIALGTGLTGWMQFIMHYFSLKEHPAVHFDVRARQNILKIILSSMMMGGFLIAIVVVAKDLNWNGDFIGVALPLSLVVGGAVFYGVSILSMGVFTIKDARKFF